MLLPNLAAQAGPRLEDSAVGRRLAALDEQVGDGVDSGRRLRTLMFSALLSGVAGADDAWQNDERPVKALAQRLRAAMEPLVLPQIDALRVAERLAKSV